MTGAWRWWWVGVAVAIAGCDVLAEAALAGADAQQAPPALPTVSFQGAELAESPSQAMMVAYFCPRVVPDPLGVPGSAALACQAAFGPAPPEAAMRVSFDLRFAIKNPNRFPIPVAELLAAVVVFPDKTNQSLGAVCLAFCGANQPGCTGAPGPGACTSKASDIKSIQDFGNAAASFLIAAGVAALAGGKLDFQMPQVVQDTEINLTARFSFGPLALLKVLEQVAKQSADQLAAGKSIAFTIPYRLEGGVWFDVGSLGRVAVGYGPVTGTWAIPTTAIVPKQ